MKSSRGIRLLVALVLTVVMAAAGVMVQPISAQAAGRKYRALVIGNNTYKEKPLAGCVNDAKAFVDALKTSTVVKYDKISFKSNLSARSIATAFTGLYDWGIQAGDVTVVYYSGHGYSDKLSGDTGVVGVDMGKFSFRNMEHALASVPGTIVLLLDSCYSGGAIAKSASAEREDISAINGSVHRLFSGSDGQMGGLSAKAMTSGKYHVITAASSTEQSFESGGFGYFTTGLTEAMGWNVLKKSKINKLMGDDNSDGKLTIAEAYKHARQVVSDFRSSGDQTVQISPAGSSITLVARKAPVSAPPDPADVEILATLPSLPNLGAIALTPGQALCLNKTDGMTFASSNASVASVNSAGMITAKTRGKATITGTKNGKVALTCKVGVVSADKVVKKIALNASTARLRAGAKHKLKVRLTPLDPALKTVRWYSADKSVAVVSAAGVVKGVKPGTVKIYGIASNGLSDVCIFEVVPQSVTSVGMKNAKLKVRAGETKKLRAKALPETATNKKLSWSSSDPLIASVDPDTGLVKAIKPGRATIIAKATDGSDKFNKCVVTVTK